MKTASLLFVRRLFGYGDSRSDDKDNVEDGNEDESVGYAKGDDEERDDYYVSEGAYL